MAAKKPSGNPFANMKKASPAAKGAAVKRRGGAPAKAAAAKKYKSKK